MNDKFDELAKSMARSVTRREAVKNFGVRLGAMVLACFALANKAVAAPKGSGCGCVSDADCNGTSYCSNGVCLPQWCDTSVNPCCCYEKSKLRFVTARPTCDNAWGICASRCPAGG